MRDYGRDNACYECGAITHPDHYGQHSNFHANFIHRSEVKDGFAVSAVKWCDAGNHAFKANAPGSQSLDVTQRGDDGKEERVTMDMCASHAFPTAPQTDTLRQVEKSYEQERLALDSRQYAPTDQPVWGGSEYPAT